MNSSTTIHSLARDVYLPPVCFVVELSTETPVLQFSTKDWEKDPDVL